MEGAEKETGDAHLLVDHNEDLHALLSLPQEQPVEPKILVLARRTSKEQLGREPPIENPDRLACFVEDLGEGVEVVVAILRKE